MPVPPSAREFDLVVVGGGVNGVGIARDAAGRGLSVLLCERDDLASQTSSASTKLIHGGLRYLEHGEFGLVRKALVEREVLMRAAPHLVRPLSFVVPLLPGMRPAWLVRLGLMVYDHLARRRVLPASRGVRLDAGPFGEPLRAGLRRGFVYADAWVDDARLVVLAARDAADRGARVLTRTTCTGVRRDGPAWTVSLRGADAGAATVRARALVDATGPWAGTLDVGDAASGPAHALRLVRGSHIVVPRLYAHDAAYLLQLGDRRVVFAIPWEEHFTMIGTTEVEQPGPAAPPRIGAAEVDYLCDVVRRYFRRPVAPGDVVWSFSGLRPLLDDDGGSASALSRDYRLVLERDGPPRLTVYGGKITTFRRLAEEALDRLAPLLGLAAPPWTREAPLPGGDLSALAGPPVRPDLDFARFVERAGTQWPWLPAPLLHRWARAYGSRMERVIGGAHTLADLGDEIVPGLHEAELRHLMRDEWACDADDVLWRRTKLGVHLDATQRERVAQWMRERPPVRDPARPPWG